MERALAPSRELTFVDFVRFTGGIRDEDHVIFLDSKVKHELVGGQVVFILESLPLGTFSIVGWPGMVSKYRREGEYNEGTKTVIDYIQFSAGPNIVCGSNGIRSKLYSSYFLYRIDTRRKLDK